MAKNKVQFQKSMNIHAFIQRYGNEDLCQQRLLIFAGLKASDVQTVDIPTIASFTRERFTNVISVTNKPR